MGMLRVCSEHWSMMQQAIKDRGLWDDVSITAEEVMDKGDKDPLFLANTILMCMAIDHDVYEGCPICIAPNTPKDLIEIIMVGMDEELEDTYKEEE